MVWHRRVYEIDNREVSANKIDAFLHIARTKKICDQCGDFIKKGDAYVIPQIYAAEPQHLTCYIGGDKSPVTLAIKVVKRRTPLIDRIESHVICKIFEPVFKYGKLDISNIVSVGSEETRK